MESTGKMKLEYNFVCLRLTCDETLQTNSKAIVSHWNCQFRNVLPSLITWKSKSESKPKFPIRSNHSNEDIRSIMHICIPSFIRHTIFNWLNHTRIYLQQQYLPWMRILSAAQYIPDKLLNENLSNNCCHSFEPNRTNERTNDFIHSHAKICTLIVVDYLWPYCVCVCVYICVICKSMCKLQFGSTCVHTLYVNILWDNLLKTSRNGIYLNYLNYTKTFILFRLSSSCYCLVLLLSFFSFCSLHETEY